MSGYLVEHLIENYHGKGFFSLNDNEVKMGLKDVALISGTKVVNTDFKAIEAKQPMFTDRFFCGTKIISYHEINQSVFDSRFIREVRSGMRNKVYVTLISGGWFICLSCASPSSHAPTTVYCPGIEVTLRTYKILRLIHGKLTCMK